MSSQVSKVCHTFDGRESPGKAVVYEIAEMMVRNRNRRNGTETKHFVTDG